MKHDPTHEHDSLPPALLDAMRGLDTETGFDHQALTSLDTAVLSGARQHIETFAQRRRMRLIFTCAAAGSGFAAAAAITLVVWMGGLGSANDSPGFADTGGSATHQVPTNPELSVRGEVDILDAFALARRKRDSEEQIDQAMIDAIAQRAVSVSEVQGGNRG